MTGAKRHQTTAAGGPEQDRKGAVWLHLHVFHFLFYSSGFPIRCSALQLFIVLLEVEETDRMKTTALPEAEEKKLVEETQRKVEHIYSQLQHHESV